MYSSADLPIRIVSCYELLRQSHLIPQVCPTRIWSQSDINSLITRHLKTPIATHRFWSFIAQFLPGRIVTHWSELIPGKHWSSTSYGEVKECSRLPGANITTVTEGPVSEATGLRWTSSKWKSNIIAASMRSMEGCEAFSPETYIA